MIDKNCQERGFWNLSQNRDIRNRFVYNPKTGGIYELGSLINKLYDIGLRGEIKPKLENNQGLSIFAKERAKFEGWLKVELRDSLSKYFKDVAPERNRVDVTFENWAIELKTVNTNIRYKNVKNKTRPITKNT